MKTKKMFTSFVLAMALILCCAMPAFAAEVPSNEMVEPASMNASTLKAGENTTIYSQLTFRNYHTTGNYYVQGRWLNLNFDFKVADSDNGLGGIFLTIKVYDATTGEFLGQDVEEAIDKGYMPHVDDMTFDLGEFGRTVYLVIDASSRGASNGNYRSATLYNFNGYAFG